jgi:hypothetical protein
MPEASASVGALFAVMAGLAAAIQASFSISKLRDLGHTAI